MPSGISLGQHFYQICWFYSGVHSTVIAHFSQNLDQQALYILSVSQLTDWFHHQLNMKNLCTKCELWTFPSSVTGMDASHRTMLNVPIMRVCKALTMTQLLTSTFSGWLGDRKGIWQLRPINSEIFNNPKS